MAFVALVVLAGADAVSVIIRSTLVPLATPDHMRGRVMAVENVFIGASNELGAFESGVASTLLGLGPAVVLGGVLTLGVVGVFWFLFPSLRDVDRFDDVIGDTVPEETPTGLCLTRATMRKFFAEFRDFINKGDVITIAVGLVMALYFQEIVNAVLTA